MPFGKTDVGGRTQRKQWRNGRIWIRDLKIMPGYFGTSKKIFHFGTRGKGTFGENIKYTQCNTSKTPLTNVFILLTLMILRYTIYNLVCS